MSGVKHPETIRRLCFPFPSLIYKILTKHFLVLILLSSLATGLHAAGDPAHAQLVEQRLRVGREGMAQTLLPKGGAGWKLVHALAVAEVKPEAASLNAAILAYHAGYDLDPEKAPTAYHDPRPNPAIFHLYLKPRFRKLLSPEAAAAIEDICRRWVHRHSFLKDPVDAKGRPWPLNNPTKNVWIISGSENHDLAQRSANLLSL